MPDKPKNPKIELELDKQLFPRFARLFSKGVTVRARIGCSLRDFICEQLGIAEDYLEQRIQTIFLNGKAVDNYQTSFLGDGDSLALSAAMPGLVGAVFRRGGYYAALRNTVTYRDEGTEACTVNGEVTVKLFNLTVKELGPVLLKHGVRLAGRDLKEQLEEFADDFREGSRQIIFNGARIRFDDLLEKIQASKNIDLTIKTDAS